MERAEDTILNGSDERLFGPGRLLHRPRPVRRQRGDHRLPTTGRVGDPPQQGGRPCKGAVVALEPSTGKILAMVSAPSYDPNLLSSHDVASSRPRGSSFATPKRAPANAPLRRPIRLARRSR